MRLLTEHLPLKQGLRPKSSNSFQLQYIILTEHLPLKQGLRLGAEHMVLNKYKRTHRASSTKTRIKTWLHLQEVYFFSSLTEHLPLKQGLRPIYPTFFFFHLSLTEHLPLKQGLRLKSGVGTGLSKCSQSIFH